mgnify:FL=1
MTTNSSGTNKDTYDLITNIFGSDTGFKGAIQTTISNHQSIHFHFDSVNNCLSINNVYAYKDEDAQKYELSFMYTFINGNNFMTKTAAFHYEPNAPENSWHVIKDLV